MNQHFERKGCFSTTSCEVLWEFCMEAKTEFSLLCHASPIIMTLMPMFATYGVKVEQMILFMKIANRYFERKSILMFFGAPVLTF